MEYVTAAIIVAVLGFCVFLGIRAYEAGQDRQVRKDLEDAAKRRKKADEILAEQTADEDAWLDRAKRRLDELRGKEPR